MVARSIRDLIDGNRSIDGEVDDLQSLVDENPPLLANRTEAEEVVKALQPGDDPSSHPCYDDNPFKENPIETWRRLRDGLITDPEERRLAEEVVARLRAVEDGHLAHR